MADNTAVSVGDNTSQFFMGQIDAKVSQLLDARHRDKEDLKSELRNIHSRIDRNDARITVLERGSWRVAGVVAAVASIPAVVVLAGHIIKIAG